MTKCISLDLNLLLSDYEVSIARALGMIERDIQTSIWWTLYSIRQSSKSSCICLSGFSIYYIYTYIFTYLFSYLHRKYTGYRISDGSKSHKQKSNSLEETRSSKQSGLPQRSRLLESPPAQWRTRSLLVTCSYVVTCNQDWNHELT